MVLELSDTLEHDASKRRFDVHGFGFSGKRQHGSMEHLAVVLKACFFDVMTVERVKQPTRRCDDCVRG